MLKFTIKNIGNQKRIAKTRVLATLSGVAKTGSLKRPRSVLATPDSALAIRALATQVAKARALATWVAKARIAKALSGVAKTLRGRFSDPVLATPDRVAKTRVLAILF